MITGRDEGTGQHRALVGLTDAEALSALIAQTKLAYDSGDPLRVLHALTERRALLDRGIADTVSLARAQGLTWQAIGDALGTTRQAAWQHFQARGSGATWHLAEPD